jgi:hypothetical protein
MSGSLMATPASRPSRPANPLSPLLPTPLHQRSGIALTPNLYNGADWGTPSWGGEDAKMLQEFLSSKGPSGQVPPQSSAVTPGIIRSALRGSDAPPSSVGQTPRVFFKDELTETINFKYQVETTPLPVSIWDCLRRRYRASRPLVSLISFLGTSGNSICERNRDIAISKG